MNMNTSVHSAIDIAHRTSAAQMFVVFAGFLGEIKILNYFPLSLIYKVDPSFKKNNVVFLFLTLHQFS